MCAVTTAGAAYCWGYGGYGQLGTGSYGYSYGPTAVTGLTSGVTRITAADYSTYGDYATCFLQNGAVKCTGYDDYDGFLLQGSTSGNEYNTPQASVLTSGIVSLGTQGAGGATCAITSSGTVKCWGYGPYGLGDGSTYYSGAGVAVANIASGAVSVSSGYYNSCVVLASGTMYCWGYNGYGGVGDGTTTTVYKPTTAATISGVISSCNGYGHTCALTSGGAVKCVGYNPYGQLGNGTTTNSSTWVTPIASGAVGVTCGIYHTCALMSSGKAECWGYNYYGAAGNGTFTSPVTTPSQVQGF
jgi:alpha-tubulin suppressor-like RCC1 family protein